MLLLCLLVLCVTVAYVLYHYFTRTFNYWNGRNVVGPRPVPFFGNLKESTLRRTHNAMVMKELYEDFPNEKVVGIFRMTTPCLLIRDLDIVKNVMIKDFECFVDRGVEFSKEGLGANLFHSDGDTWRVLRNRFSPLFTSGKLKNMTYLIAERGDKFVDDLQNVCVKRPEQDVYTLLQDFTIASIAACAFGLDIQQLDNDKLRKIDELMFTTSFANELDMMYPGILKKFNTSIFPRQVSEFFLNLVRVVIDQRNGMPTDRKDFMDLILELRQQKELVGSQRQRDDKTLVLELTEGVIASVAFSFYAAGYETSATTLAFLLYRLALNPKVQDKLIAEIDETIIKCNGKITYDMLNEMTYLQKVFDETLRMHPTVDPLQRNAKNDYILPGTDITVKHGQTVIVSLLGIHYDEKYYPDPDQFDPERFNKEGAGKRHPCAYMPFGVGPRNCLGMRFAKVQSRICVVKMLSKFRVEPSKNTNRSVGYNPRRLLLSPQGGIYLNIVPRKK